MGLIDTDELLNLFAEEFKRTKQLIADGETHLDSLAEGYTEAAHVAKYLAPTVDATPVVRCRCCVYAQLAKINKKGFRICPASHMEITDDDFCSYGEKRSEPPVQHRPELEGGIT